MDDSPDTSWLGEYSDRASSEFSIDRYHDFDCAINTSKAAGTSPQNLYSILKIVSQLGILSPGETYFAIPLPY